MPTSSKTELDTRVLDALIRNLDGNVADAIAKAAFMVEGRAKIKAPVDTGALRASIYTSLKGSARFAGARAEAIGRSAQRNRMGQVRLLTTGDFMQLPEPRDEFTAFVGPSVEYGQAVELGSVKRSGTPYLQPALRETEKDIRDLLSKAVQNVP